MVKVIHKKVLSLCLAFFMVMGYVFANPVSFQADEEIGFCIKIIHTNDVHARVQENENSGIIGMERLKTLIEAETAGADIDLVLDSGDMFHGQPIATLVQGESIAKLIKECGYDAMTAGNHDWNYGKDRLKELRDISEVPILTGNVRDETGAAFLEQEYHIEEVEKDGQILTVAVFGVSDPDMSNYTAPENVAGLEFTDAVEYAQNAADLLKDIGCDIVIALYHGNHPTEIASKVDGVNLWLCGHEHMSIDTTVTTPDGSTAYVIENGYYMYEVGFVEIDCAWEEDGSLNIHFASDSFDMQYASAYEKDPGVESVMNDITSGQEQILSTKVGETPVELDGVWENLRIGETNLGRAVADSYILETGADVAFENAGGIRASISAGDVTYGDIISVSPYGNYIVTKEITGKQLEEILETAIDIQLQNIAANDSGEYDAWPQNSGSYLQTAGITVEYNPALEKGSRVISVKVGDNKLEEDKLYTVATNQYMAASSDYPQLAESAITGEYSACDEAIINYFKQGSEAVAASDERKGMVMVDITNPDENPTEQPLQTETPQPASGTEEQTDTSDKQQSEEKSDLSASDKQTESTEKDKQQETASPAYSQKSSTQTAPKTGDVLPVTACVIVLAVSAEVLAVSRKKSAKVR